MFLEIVFYLFAISSTFYLLHFGLYLTGANLYDIWQFRRQHRHTVGRHKYEPLVTVAISAHNEEKVIMRCLESIANNTYKRIQIIVVDDGSKDRTSAICYEFLSSHPNIDMRIITYKQNVGKGGALNSGLKRHAKGELVMTLDADSVLAPDAIKNATAYFLDPSVAGVAANVQIIKEPTILGLLQKFEHMVGYRSKKTYSLANCEFIVGGVASTYRLDILQKVGFYDTDTVTEDIGLSMKVISNGNKAHRLVYAVDVVAMTEGVVGFKALAKQRFRWKYGSLQNIIKYYRLIGRGSNDFTPTLTFYRMPTAVFSEFLILITPLIWLCNLYLMFQEKSIGLIIGAYVIITLYSFITLWWDEHASLGERLTLSLCLPFLYFMFYIMDLVQLVAVVRCLFKSRSLLSGKNVGSAWVSPKRVGRQIAAE